MSLRGLVVLLIVANLGVAVWSQGWLDDALGLRRSQREPERMSRQIDAESLRALPPPGAGSSDGSAARPGAGDAGTGPARAADPSASAASAAWTPPPAPADSASAAALRAGSACLEAGPFGSEAEAAAAERSLASLPAGSWVRITDARPGRHAIVMGRFASEEALRRKVDELRRLRLPFETLSSPPAPAALAGTLSLGRFEGREAADAALASLAARGVKTARIETLAPAGVSYRLRAAQADAALAAQIAGIEAGSRPVLAGGFRPCESLASR